MTIDDSDELSYENLSLIYLAQGEYRKALHLLLPKADAFASYFGFHDRLAMVYLYLGQYDLNVALTGVCDVFDWRAQQAIAASQIEARPGGARQAHSR